MATYYFRNVGTNWGDAANWSLTDGGGATGAVPLATDDVIFTNNSGNCTVNALNRVCQTLNFNGGTGYINTITFTFNISVGGSITLGASMVFSGASSLRYVGTANSTFTSNGKEVGVPFEIAAATNNHTITYADNWTFGENFTIQSGTASVMTFTGNTINCKKSLLNNNAAGRFITGTTSIIMIGTGSIGSTSGVNVNIGLNLTINTAGSYTFNTFIWGYLGNNILTYSAGTITVAVGTTLFLISLTSNPHTLNLNGIDFENIQVSGGLNLTPTITLTSNLKCKTLVKPDSNSPTFNGNTLFLTSYVSTANVGSTIRGSTIFYFNCWSGNGSLNAYQYGMSTTTIDISNGNTLTIGNVTFNLTGSLTHIQGTIFIIGLTLSNSCTLNLLPNDIIQSLTFNGATNTNTLQSDITALNVLTIFNATFAVIINGVGFSLTVLNTLTFAHRSISGTAKLILAGNVNAFFNMSNFTLACVLIEVEINSTGVVTFNSNCLFQNTLSHVKGTVVVVKDSFIQFLEGSIILGASRFNFDNVRIAGGVTVTMDEFFCGTPQRPTKVISTTTANYFVNFRDGFEKIAKNVIVSNCTVNRRGQLLLLSKGSFRGTNIGIRYYNQSPNGVGSNLGTFVDNTLPSTQGFRKIPMLVGDPAYT
jgi:hypothetical protein